MSFGSTTFATKDRAHAVVAALLLIALVLRALLPSGAMVVASHSEPGTFEMTICSSSATHTVVVADPLNPEPARDHVPTGHDHNLCGFAATANIALPPLGALLPPAYTQLGAPPELSVSELVVMAALVGPPLGSRAPPPAV